LGVIWYSDETREFTGESDTNPGNCWGCVVSGSLSFASVRTVAAAILAALVAALANGRPGCCLEIGFRHLEIVFLRDQFRVAQPRADH
jgi:hypothetical protein